MNLFASILTVTWLALVILYHRIHKKYCKIRIEKLDKFHLQILGAFLAAADSKKFAIFNVKTGKYLGELRIPSHLERSKGKEEKYCMFEQTGLRLVNSKTVYLRYIDQLLVYSFISLIKSNYYNLFQSVYI